MLISIKFLLKDYIPRNIIHRVGGGVWEFFINLFLQLYYH